MERPWSELSVGSLQEPEVAGSLIGKKYRIRVLATPATKGVVETMNRSLPMMSALISNFVDHGAIPKDGGQPGRCGAPGQRKIGVHKLACRQAALVDDANLEMRGVAGDNNLQGVCLIFPKAALRLPIGGARQWTATRIVSAARSVGNGRSAEW
jgi:hypothetical protein